MDEEKIIKNEVINKIYKILPTRYYLYFTRK